MRVVFPLELFGNIDMRIKICLLLTLFALGNSSAHADFWYFSWSETSPGEYSANVNSISAGLTYSTSAGDSTEIQTFFPSAILFQSRYGGVIPTFVMTNGDAGSSANSVSSITFNTALPDNSILIAFDVDTIRNDEFRFFNQDGGPLSLIEQLESIENATSTFPIWDSNAQTLTSANIGGNQSEASVFDISGNSTIDIGYFRDAGGSSLGGSVFAIGIAIPEPGGFFVLVITGLCFTFRRRKSAKQLP